MEHIIYSNAMKHLQTNNILSDVQHGFRNKRSSESQLLLTTNDFVIGLNIQTNIKDMPAFVKSKLRLFADDAYLYKVIKV